MFSYRVNLYVYLTMVLISMVCIIVSLAAEGKSLKVMEIMLFAIWSTLLVSLAALNVLVKYNLVEIASYVAGVSTSILLSRWLFSIRNTEMLLYIPVLGNVGIYCTALIVVFSNWTPLEQQRSIIKIRNGLHFFRNITYEILHFFADTLCALIPERQPWTRADVTTLLESRAREVQSNAHLLPPV
ncbi:hypothetical protein F5B19DRAFT_441083 [Rostrohypoxylon terebratum]|nr:hypothetical protein F5B19DRAFT_441083 [Rostrohypoxylon terebratum]